MTHIPNPSFGRRGLIAGAAGLLAGAPVPVLAQAVAPPGNTPGGGGQSAVIDVSRARSEPIPIAVPDLGGPDGASAQLGAEIASVIGNDLGAVGCSG